jgi:hypothetical protein
MQRVIEAPEQAFLSAKEAAAWLNIPEGAWDDMAADGVIPAGVQISSRTVRWSWEVVYGVKLLLVHLLEKVRPEK